MLSDAILNFIFPVACIICHKQVLERRWSAACPECWNTLSFIKGPMCVQCGIPGVAIEGRCGRCRLDENDFDFARSAVLFNDTAREIVHHLKYSDRFSLARPIGRILRETIKEHRFTGTIAVPVPLHRSRERARGYNQAELIARNLGLSVNTGLVRRRKNTSSQTGLSRSERARNLSAAFEATADVRGRTLLLVDDVMTTGATMNEIARTLKRAGADRVEVLTFARVEDS